MSINAMSAAASSPPEVVADTGLNQGNYLKAVTTYIPSEAIALYLFVLGLLTGSGATGSDLTTLKWIAFVIGVVAAVGLVFFTFKPGENDKAEKSANRKRWQLVVFALLAFLVYTMAAPGGPWGWAVLGVEPTIWGSVLVAIFAVGMPVVADSIGLRSKALS